MFKKRILTIIVILAMTISMTGFAVSAADGGTNACPYCIENTCSESPDFHAFDQFYLIAGQNMEIDHVGVYRNGNILTVGIYTSDWELVEWHVDVATTRDGIPHNKNGSPVPGHFRFQSTTVPASNFCNIDLSSIGIDPCKSFVLAVHAVVQKYDPCTCTYQRETAWAKTCLTSTFEDAPGANWASYVVVPAVTPCTDPSTCKQ